MHFANISLHIKGIITKNMSALYYIEKILSVNLNEYSNINIDLEINKILFFLAIFLSLGAVGLFLHGRKVALLFKRMIRLEVFNKDRAKSRSDLGLGDNRAIRRLVTNREGYLKRCIKILALEDYNEAVSTAPGEQKDDAAADVASSDEGGAVVTAKSDSSSAELGEVILSDGLISPDARIYIPEESRDFALKILNNDSGSVSKLIISCALIVGICAALIFLMSDILSLLNSLLGA